MIIANGSADVSTYFVLRDSTNHAPKTDVTVTDIDLYYVEHGAAISTKADATALASAGAAHTDNAAFHVGQGLYRIDWPDAAFDAGVGKVVTLIVVCTGVDATFLEVELSPAVNTVAVSGTAQTGRDLGASVLLSSGTGTGQISLTSGAVSVGSIAAGAITAAAIATDAIDADALAADAIAEINATVDTALADIHLDHLLATDYDPASKPGTATALLNELVESDAGVSRFTANALEQAPSGTGASAASIADAVWDELRADHVIAGSFGDIDTTADVADAVWDEARSGHVAAGSFGEGAASVQGNVTGSVGSVSGAVGSVTGAVGSVTGNVGGNVTGSVGSLATQAKADVNAELLDVLVTDTHAEPASVPAATSSLRDKIAWLFTLGRNKVTQTATTQTLRNDADSANIATATVSDDATTFTKGEWS